jgi:hypothetical protein
LKRSSDYRNWKPRKGRPFPKRLLRRLLEQDSQVERLLWNEAFDEWFRIALLGPRDEPIPPIPARPLTPQQSAEAQTRLVERWKQQPWYPDFVKEHGLDDEPVKGNGDGVAQSDPPEQT